MAHNANGADFHWISIGSVGLSSHTIAMIHANTANPANSKTVPAAMMGVNAFKFGMKDSPIMNGRAIVMTPTCESRADGITPGGTKSKIAYIFSPMNEKKTVHIANC